MVKIGVYTNISISDDELEKHIYSLYPKNEYTFISNFDCEEFNYFENKNEYSLNSRATCRNLLKDLSLEFYSKYKNTVLYNDDFNFWIHLRFNSFLHIIKFYKIKVWIDKIIELEKVEKILIVNPTSQSKQLLQFYYPDLIFVFIQKSSLHKKSSLLFLKKFVQIIWSGFPVLFKRLSDSSNTLIFSLKGSVMPILTENGIQKKDKFMYYLKNKLDNKDFDTLLNSNIYSRKGVESYEIDLLSKQYDFTNENLLFLALFDLKFLKNLYQAIRFMKNLKNHEKSLLSEVIINNKMGLFSELVANYSVYNFLKRCNYKNTILIGEMNPTLNAIVRMSKKMNINCIGIQHGLLNKENFGYNYSIDELKEYNPFPSKLIVWGQDEQVFLDKNKSILKDTVQAKGNIIFDGIEYLKSKKDVQKFVVMYASQPQPVIENRMKSIHDFVDAIVQFNPEDVDIIIRLHPGEFNDYGIYHEALKKLERYSFELDKGKEIITQLNKIDVLITSFSTVSKDALLLKKMVILQDYTHSDLTGLLNKEVALNAINKDELYEMLFKIKNKELVIPESNFNSVLDKMYAKTNLSVSEEIIKMLK